MANLNDLNYISITSMSQEEAFELLQKIRFSRRVPKGKKKVKKKPEVSDEEAMELLRVLGGEG